MRNNNQKTIKKIMSITTINNISMSASPVIFIGATVEQLRGNE